MTLTPEELRSIRIRNKFVDFNVLIVGRNGLGKRSFVNSLCNQQVFEAPARDRLEYKPSIVTQQVILRDGGAPLRINFHLTENWNHSPDNTGSSQFVLKFLEDKFDHQIEEESKVMRDTKKRDERIHVVFCFVNPDIQKFPILDLELISIIQNRCNIIPIIPKSDLLGGEGILVCKNNVKCQLESADLKVYDFLKNLEEDPEEAEWLHVLEATTPFSVISSNDPEDLNSRGTKFGYIDITQYSDIGMVRDLVFKTHTYEFKDFTNNFIYELYRTERLLKNNTP